MITEEQIKERLDRDCQILVDGILKTLETQPEAILLCGGYGRGEGAWFEKENGELSPYNDYDLAVITERPMSRQKYVTLRKELAAKVGINWVDIDCYTKAQLSRMTPTIHNVDLFNASTLIWGNQDWTAHYKPLDNTKIGKEDIITLYVTRMWTLLGSHTDEERDLNTDESRFFCNQMAKAVLAGCDMRLVNKHQYTTSYRERVRIVCSDLLTNEKEIALCEWAIKEKLKPSTRNMTVKESKELYDGVYNYFVGSFRFAMGKEAESYLNPNKTKGYLLFHTKYLAYIVYGGIRGNKNIKKSYDVMRAQNYVFRAYSPNGECNQDYLSKASSILIRYHYINEPISDWRQLCLIVAKARNNV